LHSSYADIFDNREIKIQKHELFWTSIPRFIQTHQIVEKISEGDKDAHRHGDIITLPFLIKGSRLDMTNVSG
jgi:hypothetical protein